MDINRCMLVSLLAERRRDGGLADEILDALKKDEGVYRKFDMLGVTQERKMIIVMIFS